MIATAEARAPTPRLLLGATALAPLAWVLHIIVLPALVPRACGDGGLWPLHLATALLLVPAFIGVWAAHRARREVSPSGWDPIDRSVGRGATFSRVGLLLSWLFTALIIAEHIPVFVIDACSR